MFLAHCLFGFGWAKSGRFRAALIVSPTSGPSFNSHSGCQSKSNSFIQPRMLRVACYVAVLWLVEDTTCGHQDYVLAILARCLTRASPPQQPVVRRHHAAASWRSPLPFFLCSRLLVERAVLLAVFPSLPGFKMRPPVDERVQSRCAHLDTPMRRDRQPICHRFPGRP